MPLSSQQADFASTERFVIEGRVGEGGMGVVYRAFDREMGTHVALKTMSHIDPDALLRFKNEFRSLADITHPNLVELYELISDKKQWYFTMELVRGVDFLSWVQDISVVRLSASGRARQSGPSSEIERKPAESAKSRKATAVDATLVATTPPRVADTVVEGPAVRPPAGPKGPVLVGDMARLEATLRQLVDGLRALHAAGKLHRDIKPSNVLVTEAGRVVLLDFGLVEEYRSETGHDRHIVGTPAYMSPEQAGGHATGPASDWYSLGVMLYEALTARVPFGGDTRHVFFGKQYATPVAPIELVRDVPDHLNDLCMDLLKADPRARPDGESILARLGSTDRTTSASSVRSAPFVGRRTQLRLLDEAFEQLEQGEARLVFVRGKSGMGKSTLLSQFLDEARGQPRVVALSGRCYERESVPFKALDSVVDDLSRWLMLLPDGFAETLVPADAPDLVRIFPVLRNVRAFDKAPPASEDAGEPAEMRRRAFGAFRELLAKIAADHRLILHVDDLQWGDVDSVELLEHVLAPPEAPAALLVFSYRDEASVASATLERFVEFTRKKSGLTVREIEVGMLSDEEALDLAACSLGNDAPSSTDLARTIARESQGIPFFLAELVRWQQERRARGERVAVQAVTLEEVVRDRIAGLPEEARSLLEVFSIASGPLEHRVAEQTAEFEQKNRAVAARLRAAKLVRTHGLGDRDEAEAFHARIRETVRAGLTEERRRALHGRLANTLEDTGRADAEALVEHYLAAGRRSDARRHVVVAADEAARGLAFERASRLYRQAVELGAPQPAHELHRKAGDALAAAGRGADAADAYLDAAHTAPEDDSLELRRLAAEHYLKFGRAAAGVEELRRVLREVRVPYPESDAAKVASLVYHGARVRMRGLRFKERPAASISKRELTKVDACFTATIGLSLIDVVRGAAFSEQYLLLALQAGEPLRVCRAVAFAASNIAAVGDGSPARTDRLVRRAEQLATAMDEPHALALSKVAAGLVSLFRGEWTTAITLLDEAEGILGSRCRAVAWELGVARSQSANARILVGRLAEAKRRISGVVKDARERDDLFGLMNLIYPNTIALLMNGDADEALEFALEVARSYGQDRFTAGHWGALISAASVERYVGDARAAWARYEREWQRLERSQLLRVNMIRVFSVFERGLSAIGAAEAGVDSRRLLELAQKSADSLLTENLRYAPAMGRLLRASIAGSRGDGTLAEQELEHAVSGLDAYGMAYLAACARHRRGQLLGGDQGAELIQQARSFFESEGVFDVEPCSRMTTPGFSELL